jgi:hypothetical protein
MGHNIFFDATNKLNIYINDNRRVLAGKGITLIKK